MYPVDCNTRKYCLQMTTHELSEAEDKLARLQAEHEEALRKTELDLCNLRDRCAVLEAEQHADVDACATSRCLTDTPQVRRAYLAGKTEGQRESIAAHTKVESLSQALETTEKKALSANVQLLELKVCISCPHNSVMLAMHQLLEACAWDDAMDTTGQVSSDSSRQSKTPTAAPRTPR